MIPKECRRIAEIDFPLSEVNDACIHENNIKTRINSGHISLLHTWWARRPLSSCRSVLLALLLPDPTDDHCPASFKETARAELAGLRKIGPENVDLLNALVRFVGELAEWDLVGKGKYVSIARQLLQAAYGSSPLVFDPFSGGGSIPFEGLRLGCEVTASELNPVALLQLKILLDWCARNGDELVNLFGRWSQWVLDESERRLKEYYPDDSKGRQTFAYLWARTIRCEAAGCGATIPLIRSLWLSTAKQRPRALRIAYPKGTLEPVITVFKPEKASDVASGTVSGNDATCPRCSRAGMPRVTPRERVQDQLRNRSGGAFDAVMLAAVRVPREGRGKDYETPSDRDWQAFERARTQASSIEIELAVAPPSGDTGFRARAYGITNWKDAIAPRQLWSRWVIHQVIDSALLQAEQEISDPDLLNALAACLYCGYSDNSQYHTSLCVWLSEGVKSVFIQGSGVPMRSDFVEGNPLSTNCEGLAYSMRSVQSALRHVASVKYEPTSPLRANALDSVLPDESVDVVFTDPPYANQIPYAHLADFFYGWLRLGLKRRLPDLFSAAETEKLRELTENRSAGGNNPHDRDWYEHRMTDAFQRMKQTIKSDGVGAFVFAHKDTGRWEALVSALVSAGWKTTASWPIATERKQRMRGQGYAALETSVHLVCRPRVDNEVGDWAEVLRELPQRVGNWIERLQTEGIRGADLVFACIGPALEIFSRYSKVVDSADREIPLGGDPDAKDAHVRGYLSYVWEVVGRSALQQVLGTAEAKARNGAAGALEEDARLTALFLWTLQSTKSESGTAEAESDEENGEEEAAKQKKPGFSLVFDVARRFAQPLGIVLPNWEGRIIETEKGVVRLLSVSERAKQLFGEDGAATIASRLAREAQGDVQMVLFPERQDEAPHVKGRRGRAAARLSGDSRADGAVTTLDRVHAAMLLQANGQANGLRALIKTERERGPDFLRLANALSALYPKSSEEKRLLDAMLLAVPR